MNTVIAPKHGVESLAMALLLALGMLAFADAAQAAESEPHPGTAEFNLCATQYNAGNSDAAIASCDKAIKADPTRADAYFIKGSALYGNGTIDKNNKFVPLPGAVEALQKYLQLAPDGAHAPDVHAMLDALN